MALSYKVKEYAIKEQFDLKGLDGTKHTFDILVTHEGVEKLKEVSEEKRELKLEEFAEILFHDQVDQIKEITQKDYENCVVTVGFQLLQNLMAEKVKTLNSMNSMRQKIQKK